jgi:hypothetical protein
MQENMNTNESATSSVETDTVKNSEVYFFTTSTLKSAKLKNEISQNGSGSLHNACRMK